MVRSGGVSLAGVAAVLFDLDGVLVHTEPWHAERTAWAARHGRARSEDDTKVCMGLNSWQWARTMRDRAGVADDPATILEDIVGTFVASIPPAPDAFEAADEVIERFAELADAAEAVR